MLVKGKKRSAKKAPGISRKVMAVLTALVIGVACYSVTVYAWFQANIANSGNTITTATFKLDVKIEDQTSIGDGMYNLTKGTSYTVTLARTGEAKGYCVIEGNGKKWYTEQIKSDTFTFTFIPEANGNYSFTASWGTPPEGTDLIKDDGVVGKIVTENKPSGALSKPQGSANSEKPNTDTNVAEPSEENVSSEESVSSTEQTEGSVNETQTSDETMVSTEQESGNEAE